MTNEHLFELRELVEKATNLLETAEKAEVLSNHLDGEIKAESLFLTITEPYVGELGSIPLTRKQAIKILDYLAKIAEDEYDSLPIGVGSDATELVPEYEEVAL